MSHDLDAEPVIHEWPITDQFHFNIIRLNPLHELYAIVAAEVLRAELRRVFVYQRDPVRRMGLETLEDRCLTEDRHLVGMKLECGVGLVMRVR